MSPVVEALSLLTPFDIDKKKVRIGPAGDGGYVFVDGLSPDQAVVSYGISTEYRFDLEMAERGHHVFMFDHTIDGITATSEKMHFFREGVAGSTDPSASLFTIEDHLDRHQIRGERLILKMDVEGAEFDAFAAVPDTVLERFEQIALEVHGLQLLNEPAYRESFCAVFRKINKIFTLFHVHANNFDGPNGIRIVSGLPVSSIIELSYVKTSMVRRRPSETLYPTELDFPNTPNRDKLLWFYPFLPTPIASEEFARCAARVHAVPTTEPPSLGAVERAPASLVNVAIGKPATQSSTSQWSVANESSRAVSGVMPQAFAFHTDLEDRPWWQVDLLHAYPIDSIVVHNRLDGLTERAKSLVVEVSEDAEHWTIVRAGLTFFSGGSKGPPLAIPLKSRVRSRYVRLSLGEKQYLHLAQVEVFVHKDIVNFSSFRERYGLRNLRLKVEGIPLHEHRSYALEVADPKAGNGQIVGIRINLSGRFGNLMQQYTNAIIFAEKTGLKYVQLGVHALCDLRAPKKIGSLTFLPHHSPLPDDGIFISGVFYDSRDFRPVLDDVFTEPDEKERCRVVREIIRPHLMTALPCSPDARDPDELTIHIRSGDVFDETGEVNSLYRQPPLSFYLLVVTRLISEGEIDRVRLVFEDRANPCIGALERFLTKKRIPFRVQSGTLAEDLAALLDSPRLAVSFGTFGISVCRLSKSIKSLYFFSPEIAGDYARIPGIERVFAVHDRAGRFTKIGEWRNSPEQLKLMLTYPITALRIEELTCPAHERPETSALPRSKTA